MSVPIPLHTQPGLEFKQQLLWTSRKHTESCAMPPFPHLSSFLFCRFRYDTLLGTHFIEALPPLGGGVRLLVLTLLSSVAAYVEHISAAPARGLWVSSLGGRPSVPLAVQTQSNPLPRVDVNEVSDCHLHDGGVSQLKDVVADTLVRGKRQLRQNYCFTSPSSILASCFVQVRTSLQGYPLEHRERQLPILAAFVCTRKATPKNNNKHWMRSNSIKSRSSET